jgi:hypothetical protein
MAIPLCVTRTFFDFGASARMLPNGRVAISNELWLGQIAQRMGV